MLVYAEGPFHLFDFYRHIMHKMPSNIGHGSECMICTPTWVGILLSIVFDNTPSSLVINDNGEWYMLIVTLLVDGCIASGGTWLLHTLQEYFENNTLNTEEIDD